MDDIVWCKNDLGVWHLVDSGQIICGLRNLGWQDGPTLEPPPVEESCTACRQVGNRMYAGGCSKMNAVIQAKLQANQTTQPQINRSPFAEIREFKDAAREFINYLKATGSYSMMNQRAFINLEKATISAEKWCLGELFPANQCMPYNVTRK